LERPNRCDDTEGVALTYKIRRSMERVLEKRNRAYASGELDSSKRGKKKIRITGKGAKEEIGKGFKTVRIKANERDKALAGKYSCDGAESDCTISTRRQVMTPRSHCTERCDRKGGKA